MPQEMDPAAIRRINEACDNLHAYYMRQGMSHEEATEEVYRHIGEIYLI